MKSFLKVSHSWLFAGLVGVCLPLSMASEARAARLANVTFTPNLFLIENQVGTVRATVQATVDPGTGSVAIETSDPFLYYSPFGRPDPTVDFPCGLGTPGDVAGLVGSTIFNFGNQAQCANGEGYYGFFYEARVTNNEGAFPPPPAFQALSPIYGFVSREVAGNVVLEPIPAVAATDTFSNGRFFKAASTDVTTEAVPEPGSVMGIALMSLAALGLKLKRGYC